MRRAGSILRGNSQFRLLCLRENAGSEKKIKQGNRRANADTFVWGKRADVMVWEPNIGHVLVELKQYDRDGEDRVGNAK